jgi:hypothetical protein
LQFNDMVSSRDRCAGSAEPPDVGLDVVRFYARAYEADERGGFTVRKIIQAEDEASSLILAEALSRTYVGAVAFSLCPARLPLLESVGRFGQTPD